MTIGRYGEAVTSLRRLLLDHRTLALWLALAALAVRLLVPAGFMAGQVDGRVVLQICSGYGPVTTMPVRRHGAMTMSGPMAAPTAGPVAAGHAGHAATMAGGHGADHDDARGHAGTEMPCAYAALAHGAVAAADVVLLELAIAFVMALGFAARPALQLRSRVYLRPPLRGPPLFA